MTELEPRRSGRKTKGQHTRNSDIFEPAVSPQPKQTPTSNKKKAGKRNREPTPPAESPDDDDTIDENEDEGIIRCPCGATSEDDGSRQMVQCEGCNIWQHNQCLGVPNAWLKKNEDAPWFCEICKPENHKEFLEKVERGERPWEKRAGGKRKSLGATRTSSRKKKDASEGPADAKPSEAGQKDDDNSERAVTGGPSRASSILAQDAQIKTEDTDDKMEVVESQSVGEHQQVEEDEAQTTAASSFEDAYEQSNRQGETPRNERALSGGATVLPALDAPLDSKHASLSEIKPSDNEDREVEMTDVTEEKDKTPISPMSGIKELKRNDTTTESLRSLKRRATTNESDGEYHSDSEKSHDAKQRRYSITRIQNKDTPKPPAKIPRKPSLMTPRKFSKVPEELTVQSELVSNVNELRNSTRRNIYTFLLTSMQKVVEQNKKILTEDQKKEDFPAKLALSIEHELYLALWNKHCEAPLDYKNKAKAIHANLPKNPELQEQVLKGEVTPYKLAQMTSEEMARKELQQLTEQLRRESELQHTILSEETGPRIRRTHKGEEFVGEDDGTTHVDASLYGSAPAPADPIDEEMSEAPEIVGSPPPIEEPAERSRQASLVPQTPLTPTMKTPQARTRQFSIENVWNNIETPDQDKHPRLSISTRVGQQLPIGQAPQNSTVDPEIDKLLAEDHDMDAESPPYSPSDELPTDPNVWRGRIAMGHGVHGYDFHARAPQVGGPDLSQTVKASELVKNIVQITGRIPIERAHTFLCGLKWSDSTEILLYSVEPDSDQRSTSQFNMLFEYFKKKERYGVIGEPMHPSQKDCYLVPIEPNDEIPVFIPFSVKGHQIPPTPRNRRYMCLVLVLSKNAVTTKQTPQSQTIVTPTQPHAGYQLQQVITPPTANGHINHTQQQSPYNSVPSFHQSTPQSVQQHHPSSVFTFNAWPEIIQLLPQLSQKEVHALNKLAMMYPGMVAARNTEEMVKLIHTHPELLRGS